MGKLMIRKLRDDWTASRGGRKAWHEFHDAFLTYGGPPIPMVRQQMLGVEGACSKFLVPGFLSPGQCAQATQSTANLFTYCGASIGLPSGPSGTGTRFAIGFVDFR